MRPNSLCPIFVAALVVLPCAADAALSAERNTVWNQDSPGIIDEGQAGDRFGSALATGDFNGDGFDDFAVGVPGEDLIGEINAGAVNVFYGSRSGITVFANRFLTQDDFAALGGSRQAGAAFGSALAVGDFDRDGYDDLAIGAPSAREGGAVDSGVVNVFYGTANGFRLGPIVGQLSLSVVLNEDGDGFGAALAVGDFDGDGYDDLAIGAPTEDVGSVVDSGGVAVVFGGMRGLDPTRAQAITQNDGSDQAEAGDLFGIVLSAGDYDGDGFSDLAVSATSEDLGEVPNAGSVEIFFGPELGSEGHRFITRADDFGTNAPIGFGNALASADLANNGSSDLLIGLDRNTRDVLFQAGAVLLLVSVPVPELGFVQRTPIAFNIPNARFGSALAFGQFDPDVHAPLDFAVGAFGVEAEAGAVQVFSGVEQFWSQNSPGIAGTLEAGDAFGLALAVGDFDNDGIDDLLIGAPGEALGNRDAAGTVNLIYGASDVIFRSGFEAGEL